MRRFQRVYSLILHSSKHSFKRVRKKWEISFSSSLDEQTIKSAIIEFYFESSLGIERGEQKKHIRVGRMQSRQPVRHENCYSRAGTGTGAHKLRIRCFTCHIPANHHISVRSSCHVHTQRITSRARLIRIKQDAWVSNPCDRIFRRSRSRSIHDFACDTFGKSPAVNRILFRS